MKKITVKNGKPLYKAVAFDYTIKLINYYSNPDEAIVKVKLGDFPPFSVDPVTRQLNTAEKQIFLVTRRIKSNLVTYKNVRKIAVNGSLPAPDTTARYLAGAGLRKLAPRAATP